MDAPNDSRAAVAYPSALPRGAERASQGPSSGTSAATIRIGRVNLIVDGQLIGERQGDRVERAYGSAAGDAAPPADGADDYGLARTVMATEDSTPAFVAP